VVPFKVPPQPVTTTPYPLDGLTVKVVVVLLVTVCGVAGLIVKPVT
jgi:hypothetical protein